MENEWHYIYYHPEDFALAEQWCKEHGRVVVQERWLPETGFILCNPDPVIFFWMFFDPSCSAGFIDWVITKPGTPIDVLKDGIVYALWYPMLEAAKARGVDTLITRSPNAMARVMGGTGWEVYEREVKIMTHIFTKEEFDAA